MNPYILKSSYVSHNKYTYGCHKVYNEINSFFVYFRENEVTIRDQMASKNSKKSQESPKPTKKTRKEDPEAKTPVEPTNRPKALTVVGIGASAGGLPALRTFFEALPSDTGMAFVVVTHLHPEHESHMAEL